VFRYVFVAVAMTLTIFAFSAKELAFSIDIADKLRVRTQKITKEVLLIKLDIQKDKNIASLKKTAEFFDRDLKLLIEGNGSYNPVKDPLIGSKLASIKAKWQTFYKAIKDICQNQDSASYEYIIKNNYSYLKEIKLLVDSYSKLAKDKGKFRLANNLNFAGKERTRTQKIVKDILLFRANIDKELALKEIKKSMQLFEETLNGLIDGSSKYNLEKSVLPKRREKLFEIKKMWQGFKKEAVASLKQADNKEPVLRLLKISKEMRLKLKDLILDYQNSINRQKQVAKLSNLLDTFFGSLKHQKYIINIVGKQRLLTQKIAKLAIDCNLHIISDRCKKLSIAVKEYNQVVAALQNGNKELKIEPLKSKEAKEMLQVIKKEWIEYAKNTIRVQNSNGKDVEAIKYILKNNEKLLEDSNKLVEILIKESSKRVSYIEKAQLHIINIAAKERMLIPKMVKEYLALNVYKISSYKGRYKESMELFKRNLDGLIEGNKELGLPKATNKAIREQLLKIRKMWSKIEPIFASQKVDKASLKVLLSVNPKLLKQMDKAVTLIQNATDY
jgi:hypothetical protein